MTLKCISLWQPYASLCVEVNGAKPIETRGRAINYRGTLGIHAAKKKDPVARERYSKEPFRKYLSIPFDDLPFGALIGTVEVVDCISTNEKDKLRSWAWRIAAISSEVYIEGMSAVDDNLKEETIIKSRMQDIYAFGDFSPNRYAWILENPILFDKPIYCVGVQGFFNVYL